jgi:hypothetical protein
MAKKPCVTFDTSALNQLADDKGSASLIAGLTSGFTVRLTGTNVEEIAATPFADRRQKLLGLCRRLLSAGDCIQPYHLVVETLITNFSKAPPFDWKSISTRFPEYESEIARQEIINNQLAKEQKDHARRSQNKFVKIFEDARPRFDDLYQGGDETRPPTFCELLTRLQVEGGAFWGLGISFYERVTKNRPSEQTIRKFIDECPPFRALILAQCVAQYERCIKDPTTGRSLRAGRNDLYMSVYLPYCHQFITADPRQQRCLTEVASAGNLGVEVRSYEDFRNSFSLGDADIAP